MSAPIGTRAGKHRPASHPVLRRGRASQSRVVDPPPAALDPFDELPELRRERLGVRGSWQAQLIREIEDAVAALTGVELPEVLLDRYERALTRGHIDNLARLDTLRNRASDARSGSDDAPVVHP